MNMTFKHKVDLSKLLCFALFLCFFDAVLRVEQKNGLTLDRFFLMVPVAALVVHERRAYTKLLAAFVVFVLYNGILSFRFGSFDQYFEMSFHYFIIFNLFFFVSYLVTSPNRGRARLLRIIKLGCYSFIGVTILEIIFNFHLPNVDIYENGEYSSFFRIANDMSLALVSAIPIFLLMSRERDMKRSHLLLAIGLIFLICMNNHTKTALGSIILYCVLYIMVTLRIRVSVTLFILAVLIIWGKDVNLKISYQEYTIEDLIIQPIRNIILLQSYNDIGSIETRVNASIIGIKALFSSYFLGIGYGNSVSLLDMPGNQLELAKSLHNDTLAFLLEEGVVALVIYIYGMRRAFFMSKNTKDYLLKIKLCCFYAFPVAILSSSGVTSNYFFLISLFTLILIDHKIPQKSNLIKEKSKLTSPQSHSATELST